MVVSHKPHTCVCVSVPFRVGNAWAACPPSSSSSPRADLDPPRPRAHGHGNPLRGQQQPGQPGVRGGPPPWHVPSE